MKTRWIVSLILAVFVATQSFAQFPEDALRFATPGFGVGARSLGMGNAYTGVASDFSALYWNPAGLAQLQHGEFSFGLSHLNYKDNSSFFNASQPYTNNATNLNTLGLVFPVEVRRGSLVFAFGYTRNSNFTTGISFAGFNPKSSIIQTYARDGEFYPSDLSGNLAYQLYLANIDTISGRFISPINDSLTQSGRVIEGGGINNWSGGAAMDIARNLSVGVTVTYLSGKYKYDRNYVERDTKGVYNHLPFDFDRLVIDDNVESDISGFNARIGLLYRVPDRFRFGISIKSPTTYTVEETFNTVASSYFDNGDVYPTAGPFETPGSNKYDVITPWVFSGGASFIIRDLVLSGDIEYTDWTQLEFDNANADLIALNKDIKSIFRATANLRAGAEYDIKDYGIRIRGGFIFNPSPYEGDPSEFDQKYVTGGLGILVGESTMLDLAYARGWWKTFRSNYDPTSRVDEDIKTNNFILTFSYRF
jgi:long-subunit fatty acid transport protein